MTHTFQFDPHAVLGVAAGASLREIRDAFHQKSLKHHPDKGGDEWAFRMVARAYELLSTARVMDRASGEVDRTASTTPRPTNTPTVDSNATTDPSPAPSWAGAFATGSAPRPGMDVDSTATTYLKGWGRAARSHEGEPAEKVARIVTAELLILRYELECSVDLFARNPEDRNLSCSVHVTWPVVELAEQARKIPGASSTLKHLAEAFKVREVRKHALSRRSEVMGGRFEGWLAYPTAVMASEALEALRESLAKEGLDVEKQTREMAIPRRWN